MCDSLTLFAYDLEEIQCGDFEGGETFFLDKRDLNFVADCSMQRYTVLTHATHAKYPEHQVPTHHALETGN